MTYGYVDVISASVVIAVCMREQVLGRAVGRKRGDFGAERVERAANTQRPSGDSKEERGLSDVGNSLPLVHVPTGIGRHTITQ